MYSCALCVPIYPYPWIGMQKLILQKAAPNKTCPNLSSPYADGYNNIHGLFADLELKAKRDINYFVIMSCQLEHQMTFRSRCEIISCMQALILPRTGIFAIRSDRIGGAIGRESEREVWVPRGSSSQNQIGTRMI